MSFVCILLILAGGLFYWYEYRPAKIKHDCSWINRHSDPIIARDGKSKEEIENCKKDGGLFCDLFSESTPAQPAKDWWEQATLKEYNFCIHEKGF